MPLNSVNTNVGAMVALQSLNRTADELSATQSLAMNSHCEVWFDLIGAQC